MPCRLVFRCEICGVEPDAETQASLEEQLQHPRFGEYVDGEPARWLIWHGRGLYGRTLYGCPEHRGELKAFLREHYGTIGPHPWAMRSAPRLAPDRENSRRLARSSLPKWGYPA